MISRLRKALPYLKGSYWLLAFSLFCAFLSTGSKLAIPFLAGKAVDAIIKNGGAADISFFLILMGILLVIGTSFRYIFDYLTAKIGQRVIKTMRERVFSCYLKAPIRYLDASREGDLVLRLVNDVENVQTGLVSGFAVFYDGIVAIAFTLGFMFSLNWALALIVVVLTPLSMVASHFLSHFNSKHFKKQASTSGLLNGFSLESLNNSETITTLGIEKDREDDFDKLNDEYRRHTFKANLGASIINPLTRFVNAVVNGTVILAGAILIIKNVNVGVAFAVGDLSAFLTYAANYMQPFNEISNVVSEIDYALASFTRIDEAVHIPSDGNKGTKVLLKPVASLEARHLDFSYDSSRQIIKDFSLSIKRGEKIALVGPTGCGKTTLINLLMRFYDPQRGTFLANNISTQELEKASWRHHLGMVLQDTWIFAGTVYENIVYAKPTASRKEVISAAKMANADGFINRLPLGYDTPISNSSGLSVGEKQLLCVARVMLLKPEIVILDEATSNIDIRTEALLNQSFETLMKGKTSLVVAHRLSTIVTSDRIVAMKDGAIVESGTHQELMAKKGFYYALFEAQFH